MKATLYVKGVRTKFVNDASYQGYVMTSGPYGAQIRTYPDYKVNIETKYKSILPEDQKAVVEMVKAAAVKYGFKLNIVDVAEKRFLDKFTGRQNKITVFPTFVTDAGFRIEGDITEDGIEALFANEPRIDRRAVRDSRFKMRLTRGMLSYCISVFILTFIGLAVLGYGIFVLPGFYSFLFLVVYVMAWVMLPAFTIDFLRNKLNGKKVLVLTVGVILIATLFTHSVWMITSPKWSFSVSTDKPTYRLGELVTITASLRNEGLISHYFISVASDPVLFTILGPDGRDWQGPYHENITTFSLSASQTLERTFTWNQSYVPGTYQIVVSIPDAEAGDTPYGLYPPNPALFWTRTSINITFD